MLINNKHLTVSVDKRVWKLLLVILLSTITVCAQGRSPSPNSMVLIIDDLGHNFSRDARVLLLPGPVTLSILPHTPFAQELAAFAEIDEKPVMLHLPMQPQGSNHPGPEALTLEMNRADFIGTVRRAFLRLPNLEGVNNHMGSLLTSHSTPMAWLMTELNQQQLFFVDSRTSEQSVAAHEAKRHGTPHLSRDIFLDHNPSPEAIAQQFKQAIAVAAKHGTVVVIAHPYPATLEFLESTLPKLKQYNLQLVPPRTLIQQQTLMARLKQH